MGVQHRYAHRAVYIARTAGQNLGIVRHLQKCRKPRILVQTQAGQNQNVSAIQPRHEAWPYGNAVRILNPGGQTVHTHQLLADLPRDIGQIGKRRHNTDLLRENQARIQPG